MKKMMSIVVVALMMAGSMAFAEDTGGCPAMSKCPMMSQSTNSCPAMASGTNACCAAKTNACSASAQKCMKDKKCGTCPAKKDQSKEQNEDSEQGESAE